MSDRRFRIVEDPAGDFTEADLLGWSIHLAETIRSAVSPTDPVAAKARDRHERLERAVGGWSYDD